MAKAEGSSNPARTGCRSPCETAATGSMSLSMHDGVAVWCDCCSCEAEPYWVEAFAQQASKPQSTRDGAPPE